MEAAEKPAQTAPKPLLETWAKNERMRHVPSLEFVTQKVDRDLRRRIDILYSAFDRLGHDDPRRATLEEQLRCVCRAVDRVAETARHGRGTQGPNDLGDRLHAATNNAVASLGSLDTNLFGRRYPFQSFERSRAEILWSCVLAAVCHVERVAHLIRTIEPGIDEELLMGLVTLENPVDERMREPIA